jgi:hypothetical protein
LAELIVMDRTGDTRMTFTPDDCAAVAEATERFNDLVGVKKYLAVVPGAGGEAGRILRAFDPTAEKIILNPPFIGG